MTSAADVEALAAAMSLEAPAAAVALAHADVIIAPDAVEVLSQCVHHLLTVGLRSDALARLKYAFVEPGLSQLTRRGMESAWRETDARAEVLVRLRDTRIVGMWKPSAGLCAHLVAALDTAFDARTQPSNDHSRTSTGAAAVVAHASVPLEPLFKLNGHLGRRLFVSPAEMLHHKQLLRKLQDPEGGLFALHGPRQSGKTTNLVKLDEELVGSKFCTHVMSLQRVAPPRSELSGAPLADAKRAWWCAVAAEVSAVTGVLAGAGLLGRDALAHVLRTPRGDQPFVLLLDEGDILHEVAHAEFKDEFMGFWRSVRDGSPAAGYLLHAVVLAGTFSVCILNNVSGSPFNTAEYSAVGKFNEDMTRDLFRQFGDAIGAPATVTDVLALDIFELTGGHPGLTVLCGRYVEEECRLAAAPLIDLARWRSTRSTRLPRHGASSHTGLRMLVAVKGLNGADGARARRIIRDVTISDVVEFEVDGGDDRMCAYLTAEGVLSEVARGSYSMMCRLVRMMLDAGGACTASRSDPVDDFESRVAMVLCGVIASFDPAQIRGAVTLASKQARDVHAEDCRPCEMVYHLELAEGLRRALPECMEVYPNANTERGNRRMDILVLRNREKVVVIETVAHEALFGTAPSTVESHIQRVADHYVGDGVAQGWVVVFAGRERADAARVGELAWVPTSLRASVSVMYVFHDAEWKTVGAVWQDRTGAVHERVIL